MHELKKISTRLKNTAAILYALPEISTEIQSTFSTWLKEVSQLKKKGSKHLKTYSTLTHYQKKLDKLTLEKTKIDLSGSSFPTKKSQRLSRVPKKFFYSKNRMKVN
jgi:hypothetical protein